MGSPTGCWCSVKFFRPASIRQLILVTFSLVALALIAGVLSATITVNRLSEDSRRVVLEAARIVEASRMLVEEVTAMERNARQFLVLGDPSLYNIYLAKRTKFQETTRKLEGYHLSATQRTKLQRLKVAERKLFAKLQADSPSSAGAKQAVAAFPELGDLARDIFTESGQTIEQAVARLQDSADRVQRRLVLQAGALVLAVLVLAVIGGSLITRQVRQVQRAIRRLGEGKLSTPVVMKGPRDLEELGRTLDWLRIQLLDADEAKARFLRHVSHELKTPLTAIREGAQLLSDGIVGPLDTTQAEVAQILCKNSVQLQQLIENLLKFSVITHAPEPQIKRGEVVLHQLVAEVIKDHEMPIRAKRLQVDAAMRPTCVRGDEAKLRTVVDNLISNAVKYSPADAQISVRVWHKGEEAILQVADQGPGIPA